MGHTDFHAHYCPSEYGEYIASSASPHAAKMTDRQIPQVGEKSFPPFPLGMHDLAARLAQMNQAGIARQVLSVPPALFLYWIEPKPAALVARRLNEDLAKAVHASGGRFLGLATVPLQDSSLAAAELEYAIKELGLVGVEIGASIEGLDLDDARFLPFLSAADRLGVPIFVHPNAALGGERVNRYYLAQLLGFPFDTSVALARLIFGGGFDAFPRIRWCFAHGGGAVPYLKGRLDRGMQSGVTKTPSGQPPSEYLRRVYFDALVFEPDALLLLSSSVGFDRIVLGTDWPFALSEPDPLGRVKEQEQIASDELDTYLAKNVNELLYGH